MTAAAGKGRLAIGVFLVTLVSVAIGYAIASAVLTFKVLGFGAEIDFLHVAETYVAMRKVRPDDVRLSSEEAAVATGVSAPVGTLSGVRAIARKLGPSPARSHVRSDVTRRRAAESSTIWPLPRSSMPIVLPGVQRSEIS